MQTFAIPLIILGFIAFAALAWKRLPLAAALVLLLLPTYLVRFRIGFLPTTVLELLLLVLTAVFVLRWFQKRQPLRFPFPLSVLLFLLAGIVAVLLAPDIRAALGLYRAYLLEPVIFFVILANTLRTRQDVRKILVALGIAVVGIGFVAVLQQLDFLPIAAHYGLESPPRATSVFPFPTAVGKFVGPLVALFLALLVVRGSHAAQSSRMRTVFLPGVVAFGFLGLILSFSRGALLGVTAATALLSFFSPYRRRILAVLALLVLLVLLIPQTRMNVLEVVQGIDTSTDVRGVLWQGALRIIRDHPVTGTGLASFPAVYDQYRDPAHVEFFPNPDHLILTLWIEMGLFGLLAFGLLTATILAAARRGLRTAQRPLAVGLIAAIAALLVHGLVDTPYFKNDLAVIFWTFVALADWVTRPTMPSAT